MTTFLWVALKENVKQTKMFEAITKACSNPESLLGLWKSHQVQGNLTRTFLMVPRHGRSCNEIRGQILRNDMAIKWCSEPPLIECLPIRQEISNVSQRASQQNSSAAIQSRNTMHRRPPIQGRRKGICWRFVKSLLTDCSEMPAFGQY